MAERSTLASFERVSQAFRRWWWIVTLSSAMCNLPVVLSLLESQVELEAAQAEMSPDISVMVDPTDAENVVSSLAEAAPIDEEALLALVTESRLTATSEVELLSRLMHPGVPMVGRYDFEKNRIELASDGQISAATGVHELAHFFLEQQERINPGFKEQVGFTLLATMVSPDLQRRYDDLHAFLTRLLIEADRGSQAYTGTLNDIPGIEGKLNRFEELVIAAESAPTAQRRELMRLEAFEYYRQEIHGAFDSGGFDRVLGLHESYASVVEKVAIQDFSIPPELEAIVCPPLDCQELTGEGEYEYVSYKEYEENLQAVAVLFLIAVTPGLIRLALVLGERRRNRMQG